MALKQKKIFLHLGIDFQNYFFVIKINQEFFKNYLHALIEK